MSLITITSCFGAGGEMIAQKVAEELGVPYYDDQKVQERALAMGVSSEELKGFDEKSPNLFDRLFTNKPAVYLDLLGSVIYNIASEGEGIIFGHGAQLFLKDFNCALHVSICAGQENRALNLAKEQNINQKEALELVQKMDKQQDDFIRYAFNRDRANPKNYDMVVNVDKVGVDWAVKLIVELARSDEVKSCSLNALEQMKISSLKQKIEAAIIRDGHILAKNISVNVDKDGLVTLSGWTRHKDDVKQIEALVKGIPGVKGLKSNLFSMPPNAY